MDRCGFRERGATDTGHRGGRGYAIRHTHRQLSSSRFLYVVGVSRAAGRSVKCLLRSRRRQRDERN